MAEAIVKTQSVKDSRRLDDVTQKLEAVRIQDSIVSEITLCNWNIKGTSDTDLGIRKGVIRNTFSETAELVHSDIICLQEVDGYRDKYIPDFVPVYDAENYGKALSIESSPYNMVLYKKEKFNQVNVDLALNKAFDLMDKKKEIYDYIQVGGDLRKTKAMKGELPYRESFNKTIFDEVLEECKQAKCFNDLLNRYKANVDELETKSPKQLLKTRMGITVLHQKKLSQSYIIVISFHSYNASGRRGADAPQRLTYLLLDFLEKLKMTGTYYPVIVAGDFNCDILIKPSAFLGSYYAPSYELRPLRARGKRIDFIVVSKPGRFPLNFRVPVISAHDMVLTTEFKATLEGLSENDKLKKERSITNHSPLSTTLQLEQHQNYLVPIAIAITTE